MSTSRSKPNDLQQSQQQLDNLSLGALKKETKQSVFRMLSEALRNTHSDDDKLDIEDLEGGSMSLTASKSQKISTKKKQQSRDPQTLPPHTAGGVTATSSISINGKSLPKSRARTSIPPKREKSFGANKDENNNIPSVGFTRIDVPDGFLPPVVKDCHLSNVLRSARRCLDYLRDVRENLSNLVGEDEQLSKGMKKVNPGPEILQLASVAEMLTLLSREAFVPAHRLNQTTIALYSAEDFLRYPTDIRTFDIASIGRIKLPDPSFNQSTIEKLRTVVDRTTEFYNKFNGKGASAVELQDILFTMMRAYQDLYTLTLGCQEVFKVLLYTNAKEKHHLQQFLLSLQSMERSDMLTEVQDLRRLIDEIVIFLEKLSWGSFVVYRLASGKTVNSTPDDSPMGTPKFDGSLGLTYPAFPLILNTKAPVKKKSTTSKREKKIVSDDAVKKEKPLRSSSKERKTIKESEISSVLTPKKLKPKKSKSKVKAKRGKDIGSEKDYKASALELSISGLV